MATRLTISLGSVHVHERPPLWHLSKELVTPEGNRRSLLVNKYVGDDLEGEIVYHVRREDPQTDFYASLTIRNESKSIIKIESIRIDLKELKNGLWDTLTASKIVEELTISSFGVLSIPIHAQASEQISEAILLHVETEYTGGVLKTERIVERELFDRKVDPAIVKLRDGAQIFDITEPYEPITRKSRLVIWEKVSDDVGTIAELYDARDGHVVAKSEMIDLTINNILPSFTLTAKRVCINDRTVLRTYLDRLSDGEHHFRFVVYRDHPEFCSSCGVVVHAEEQHLQSDYKKSFSLLMERHTRRMEINPTSLLRLRSSDNEHSGEIGWHEGVYNLTTGEYHPEGDKRVSLPLQTSVLPIDRFIHAVVEGECEVLINEKSEELFDDRGVPLSEEEYVGSLSIMSSGKPFRIGIVVKGENGAVSSYQEDNGV